MKRKGLFILCAVISLVLCACSGMETGSYEPSYDTDGTDVYGTDTAREEEPDTAGENIRGNIEIER